MPNDHQVIAKGFYQYSQLHRFITVKNYIFLRQDGKKYLLLRFFNDMAYTVDYMAFTVVQLDAAGKELDRTRVVYADLHFEQESNYAPREAIRVQERCHDFKIIFDEVRSGQYTYHIKDRTPVAYFDENSRKEARNSIILPEYYSFVTRSFTVQKKKYHRSTAAAWLAALLLLVLVGLNVFSLFLSEQEAQDESVRGHQVIQYVNTEDGRWD